MGNRTTTAAVAAAILGLWAACSQDNSVSGPAPGADPGCVAGSAQIQFGDGYQEILCGCQQAGGKALPSGGAALTCTVPVGTTIFLYYSGARLSHQTLSTGPATFASSPVSAYNSSLSVPSYAFQLTAAGTYGYMDAFDNAIVGQIIAQ